MNPPRTPLAAAVASRSLEALAAATFATLLMLTLLHLAPGDALSAIPDGEALRPVLAARWRLDDPLPLRVLHTATDLARGDLGTSWVLRPGAPVRDLLGPAGAATAWRVLAAGLLAVTLGLLPAARGLTSRTGLLPEFALAHLTVASVNALTWSGIQRGWWARPSWFALPIEVGPPRELLAVAVLACGTGALAFAARELNAARDALLRSPLVEAAWARGEPEAPIVRRHLVVPALTVLRANLPALVGGVVVTEAVLLLPGAGALFWEAALSRDREVAVALALVGALLVIGLRLAAELLILAWDPRAREAAR